MTLHMNMKKRRKHRDSLRRFFLAGAVLLSAGALSACGSKEAALNESTSLAPPVVLMEETLPQTAADETVMALTPDGPLLPSVAGHYCFRKNQTLLIPRGPDRHARGSPFGGAVTEGD